MKVCSACGEEKLLTEFYKRSNRPLGVQYRCKICTNNKMKRKTAEYREYHRKQMSAWRKASPRYRAILKKYQLKNRTRLIDRAANWRAEHHDKVRSLYDRWKKANPLQFRASQNAYRARKLNASGTYSAQEVCHLIEEFHGKCAYCLTSAMTDIEHVIPLARGGTNVASNLLPACKSCNSQKGTKTPSEWAELRQRRGLRVYEGIRRAETRSEQYAA